MACCSCFTSLACQNEVCYRQASRCGELEDFVDSKFFVCLYFKLTSFLQGLLLDERDLKETGPRGDVIMLAKRDRGKSTILFISLSTSSSFSGLDAIAGCWGQDRWPITARCATEPLMETSNYAISNYCLATTVL